MLIECYYCESKVDGKALAEHIEPVDEWEEPYKISLLECPVCKNSILAGQDIIQGGPKDFDWCGAKRLWPEPVKSFSRDLPPLVRSSLKAAQKCYKAEIYDACAVMCGKVLESICFEHKMKDKVLAGGLKELLDNQIIDQRIYEWGEELRKHRNVGAHATEEKISKATARDLLEFANAICDYIFVLSKRFEDFMQRQKKS